MHTPQPLEITALEHVTPAWLSAILRREGELPRGEVLAVTVHGNSAFNSSVSHLVLTYSPETPHAAPRNLLFKRNLEAAWAVRAGAREAGFYRLIRSLPQRLPMIVRCFDAVHDDNSGNSHLLLEDLSSTHRTPLTRDQQLAAGGNVPAVHHLRAVVAALAQFHAYWWEHSLLGNGVAQVGAWRKTEAGYAHEIERRSEAWAGLLEHEGNWFPQHHRRLIEHALATLPRLWPRFLEDRLTTGSETSYWWPKLQCLAAAYEEWACAELLSREL